MMRTFHLNLLFLLPVFYWASVYCQSKGKTLKELKPAIDQTVTCKSNQQHSYHVFVPSVEHSCKNLPLLVVIDPHGDGKLAVSQFKEAVQMYPAVVVGSNLIKNNDAAYIQELEELISDARSRYPVGETLFIGGFSGGARMSIGYAANHRVDGIIACGALAKPDQITAVNCPLVAVLGMDDFNFVDAAQFVLNPLQMPANLLLEITKASHSWPERPLLTQVLGYMQLSASNTFCFSDKEQMVKNYVDKQKIRIDSLVGANETIEATMVARNLSRSEQFEKTGSFALLFEKMVKSETCNAQMNELLSSIKFEMKIREAYYNALLQNDSIWWRKEIDGLNSKIETESNSYTQMAYKRIKGFLGIVCYSLCNQFLRSNDVSKLEQILTIYRILEPSNPDMLNFAEAVQRLK